MNDKTAWPDIWWKMHCPNGHELQSFTEVYRGRLYGFCDVCGTPYIFSDVPEKTDVPPIVIPVPPADDITIDFPPAIHDIFNHIVDELGDNEDRE
jgi:hypothetical protein